MENGAPLISVIVPIYKVEKYLVRCVDSLLSQTYSRLEIILVDDGSPDCCPAICDTYAERDPRVRVLHKENGGLSDARNWGVSHASGDYVVFVDSDDYVEPSYVEELWSLCAQYHTNMAAVGVVEEDEQGKPITHWAFPASKALNVPQALEEMFYGTRMSVFSWAKIYPRQALLDHPFPKGKIHEDLWTTYLLIDACGQVAVGGAGDLYHYVRRGGSILSTSFHAGHYNAIDASVEMVRFVEKKYPECTSGAVARLGKEVISTVYRATRSEQYQEACRYAMDALKGHWRTLLCATKLPVSLKGKLILLRTAPGLFRKLYLFIKHY